jgi:hypothetical protein
MIKRISIATFFFVLSSSLHVSAQFINLQLKIEPELSATVEQNLDFGTVVTNSGEKFINLGDLSMGVFSIKAINTQSLYIELNAPDYLVNTNPLQNSRIPLNLNISYNNMGIDDASSSTPMDDNSIYVKVYEESDGNIINQDVWQIMYLYVYGSINVGNIPNGDYYGEVVLYVDYD